MTDSPQDDPSTPRPQGNRMESFDDRQDISRTDSLKKELQGVRSINEVIEGVIGTLEQAKGNMETVAKTVDNASTLLNTWTRILSQTEHNQRLILNREWKGATQDLVDMENEALQRQQAAQRRAAEEERRKAEARRKHEAEQQRQVAPSRGTRGVRGRGRGSARVSTYRQPSESSITRSNSTRASATAGRGISGSRYGRPKGTG